MVVIETGADMIVVHDAVANSEFEVERPETALVGQLMVVMVFVSVVDVSASTPKTEKRSSIRTVVKSMTAVRGDAG